MNRLPVELAPYRSEEHGGWTVLDAAHLLGRIGFGASIPQVDQAVADGLEATIERVLPANPASEHRPAEWEEFAATEPILRRAAINSGDINQLKAWWLYRMRYSQHPLLEKMCLFWHNHFATSNAKVQSTQHMVAQNDLIRRCALGDFKQLLHGMARDVAMLIWLDSNSNRKRHPNENFARELMELFSLGVGNYTEKDIQEAARAFTGWHVRNDEFWINRVQHDVGEKTVFGTKGNFDGAQVVDLCLAQAACPRFLATKLLQTFVQPDPPDTLIAALASRIRAHDFQMTPVLRELFASEAFFARSARQTIIKSPVELVIGTFRLLNTRPRFDNAIRTLAELGQDVFEPPSVKGWEGGRLWVNSASMLLRMNFVSDALIGERYGRADDSALSQLAGGTAAIQNLLPQNANADPLDPAAVAQFVGLGNVDGARQRVLARLLLPEYQLL